MRNNNEDSEDEGSDSSMGSDEDQKERSLKFKEQLINLLFYTLALICENSYHYGDKLFNNKELIGTVASLMQISEEKNNDNRNYKKRLVKGASLLMASLTSVHPEESSQKLQLVHKPNSIQQKILDHTGLVINFCLNLVSLKDLSNLKCMIQTVGNLAILKEVNENQFLLKVGL